MPSHNYYLSIAVAVSQGSKCERKKVGCVIVDSLGRIVVTGFNGSPIKSEYPNEVFVDNQLVTQPYVLHAECNALLFSKRDLSTCKLYVTLSPCIHCAAMIIQSGIKEVYYLEEYKDLTGIDFLINHNVLCQKQLTT